MTGPTARDLELGRLSWTDWAAEQELAAGDAERRYADGVNPPGSAQSAATEWYLASAMHQTVGALDRAAPAWRQAVGWARTAHARYAEDATGERSPDSAERPLALAVVARDQDAVAELVAPYDVRGDRGRPWARVLVALAAGDDDATRAAADAYERDVPAATAAKQRSLPRLGAAAAAIVDGDAAALAGHLDEVLAAREGFVRRGHLRGNASALLCIEVLVLWRCAADRGLPVTVDDRYRAVPVRFTVVSEIAVEGTSVRGEPFLWPVDLVPTPLLDRLPHP